MVSTVIKSKREILLPTAEDLPYSVLLMSAGHASLSLSHCPLVRMLEFVLYLFTLAIKQKKPDLKCIFGPSVYRKQNERHNELLVLSMLYWEEDGKNSSSVAQGQRTRKCMHDQVLLSQGVNFSLFECKFSSYTGREISCSILCQETMEEVGHVSVGAEQSSGRKYRGPAEN